MSTVSPVTVCRVHNPRNPTYCVEVCCITWVVYGIPEYRRPWGTLLFIMVRNHHHHTYQINPSSGFWFRDSGSILVIWMSFLRYLLMNAEPGALCSLKPSMVRRLGTPSSVMYIFNEIPESDFLAMQYIPEKKVPLEKTWAYQFPSN